MALNRLDDLPAKVLSLRSKSLPHLTEHFSLNDILDNGRQVSQPGEFTAHPLMKAGHQNGGAQFIQGGRILHLHQRREIIAIDHERLDIAGARMFGTYGLPNDAPETVDVVSILNPANQSQNVPGIEFLLEFIQSVKTEFDRQNCRRHLRQYRRDHFGNKGESILRGEVGKNGVDHLLGAFDGREIGIGEKAVLHREEELLDSQRRFLRAGFAPDSQPLIDEMLEFLAASGKHRIINTVRRHDPTIGGW